MQREIDLLIIDKWRNLTVDERIVAVTKATNHWEIPLPGTMSNPVRALPNRFNLHEFKDYMANRGRAFNIVNIDWCRRKARVEFIEPPTVDLNKVYLCIAYVTDDTSGTDGISSKIKDVLGGYLSPKFEEDKAIAELP